ncbi:MAG: Flp pilus assembly protein CpaB [Acidimicrobiia bacterium]
MGRRAVVLLVALILAGLAAWAVFNFLRSVEEEALAGREITDVFIAGTNGIAEGTEGDILISAFDSDPRCANQELGLSEVPGCLVKLDTDEIEDVPTDAIDTEEKLRQVLSGRVAAGPISPGAILTARQWTEVTVDVTPLAERIPSGKQALTVSTGQVQGVNGFIEPGDRINMIITIDIEFDKLPVDFEGITLPEEPTTGTTSPEEQQVTTISYTRYVLQGIPVLATGRQVRPDENAPVTVEVAPAGGAEGEGEATAEDLGNPTIFTLEVTPEEAERIVYAFEHGSIWLTLVPADFVEVETNGVTIDNLFGGDLLDAIFGDQEG